jgi:hypothetical protein
MQVQEADEEGNGACDGSPQASDFVCEKSVSQAGLPLATHAGCCVGTISTDAVNTTLAMCSDGRTYSVKLLFFLPFCLVCDDDVSLCLFYPP